MTRDTGSSHPPALIGAGAAFEVRLFREHGRDLVEKRLSSRMRREPEARAALVREAHVLSAIKHPSVPEVVRVGSDDRGPFVVETYLAGASVRRLTEAWSQRVPRRLVAHVAHRAFRVLAELSDLAGPDGRLDLVHGDIGPDHVLVDATGDVRLVDFGAARITGLAPSLLGEGRGTLPFVAPEVARGEAPPSAAADVYALAATVLFLATGQPLCDAQGEAAMLFEVGTRGVRAELFGAAAAFRPSERDVLRRALAVDPSARVTSAAEVAEALDDEAG